jgi:hypothetical protein
VVYKTWSQLNFTNLDPEDRRGLGEKLLSDPEFFADWAPILKKLICVVCEEDRSVVLYPSSVQFMN